MIKTLYPSKPDPHVLSLVLSRAKDGAISPRLANRYSRFALSHRSCDDCVRTVWEGEQRVERSQVARSLRSLQGAGADRAAGFFPDAPTRSFHQAELAAAQRKLEQAKQDQREFERENQQRRSKFIQESEQAASKREELKKEISLLEENLEDISFGLYKPHFNFQTSEEYKAAL